jgi:2-methylcitrate dehydratase
MTERASCSPHVSVTVAHDIADFAARASWDALSASARDALKLRVLDSIGCALAAKDRPVPAIVRASMGDGAGPQSCSLIGGGRAPPDRAAFYDTTLVRYLDFNDAYLAPGETCHPSDSFAAVLAAAQVARASGSTLLTGLAVAYQVQCRLSDEAPLRERGFDHTTQGACAVAAGVARALGLDVERAAHAIAIATTTSPALRVTRTGVLSHWKGLAAAHAAMVATHATLLASHGITGPEAAFEGADGFMESLGVHFRVDWSRENLERVTATSIKRFNAEIHAQSAIEAVLEIRAEQDISPAAIRSIGVDVFDVAFDIIGGGAAGPKTDVHTKEEADHSLPYLVAVAMLDGQVLPEQFATERVCRGDVQALLRRVVVRPDPAMSRSFPHELPCCVTIECTDGRKFVKEKRDYLGFHTRPMGWQDVSTKFRRLTDGHITPERQRRIEGLVADLERAPVEQFCALLEEQA